MVKYKSFLCGLILTVILFVCNQDVNFKKIQRNDLLYIQNNNRIFNLSLSSLANEIYKSSISNVKLISSSKIENSRIAPFEIKTKTREGTYSIFTDALLTVQNYRGRHPQFNYYDASKNQYVRQSIMLGAHLKCMRNVEKLPRQIQKKDKEVKFGKRYSAIFKHNQTYDKVFGYNLFLDMNISKNAPKKQVKIAEKNYLKNTTMNLKSI